MRPSPQALATCCGLALTLAAIAGCAGPPRFPAPRAVRSDAAQLVLEFDANGDGRADYWQYRAGHGHVTALAFADPLAAQPAARLDLDQLPASDVPHLLIALDGVPFELVDELWQAGRFRLFRPPSRVICAFPSMTDLALADIFQTEPCGSFQAPRFDRCQNRLVSGNAAYLSGQNSPWASRMSWRGSAWWDVLVYLDPQTVFNRELNRIAHKFAAIDEGEFFTYSVGTAGLGTRGGRAAIVAYLETVDDFCERIVHDRRGRVKITLLADHGHNLVPGRRVSFDPLLRAHGLRPAPSLRGPDDVVTVSYGLVTYAEFYTHDPRRLRDALLKHEDVAFVCFPDGPVVVVSGRQGTAHIRAAQHGLAYDVLDGDPLELGNILHGLRAAGQVAPDGSIDPAALFDATVTHTFPDPLQRIWRAFHDLVDSPPDLIANLRAGACHGSAFFHAMIGNVASTHGALDRRDSTTFVLTMLGDLPPAMSSRDVLPALQCLRAAAAPGSATP